jgi:uncharacterized protein (DUF305 family)
MDMPTAPKPLLGALALSLALALVACVDDEGTLTAPTVAGNGADRAFVAAMIPHHRSAVEMAELAQLRSKRTEITELARTIVSTQSAEIQQMQRLDQRFADGGIERGDLGMAMDEMRTDMDAATLRDADPFDREFIDMMITHHQGAISMAQVVLRRGKNPNVRRLAEAIVEAQSEEIDQLNEWRVDWFGSLSPAGGVPESGDHMGHSG